MRNHPLTPMHNGNLVEVLAERTPHNVGLVRRQTVTKGPVANKKRLINCAATACDMPSSMRSATRI